VLKQLELDIQDSDKNIANDEADIKELER